MLHATVTAQLFRSLKSDVVANVQLVNGYSSETTITGVPSPLDEAQGQPAASAEQGPDDVDVSPEHEDENGSDQDTEHTTDD